MANECKGLPAVNLNRSLLSLYTTPYCDKPGVWDTTYGARCEECMPLLEAEHSIPVVKTRIA